MADIDAMKRETDRLQDEVRAILYTADNQLRDDLSKDELRTVDTKLEKIRETNDKLRQHRELRDAADDARRVITPGDGDKSARSRWGANLNLKSAGKPWQTRDHAGADELIGRAVDSLEHVGAEDAAIERALDNMSRQATHRSENNELARRIAAGSDPEYLRAFSKLVADPTMGHNLFTTDERQAWDRMLEARAALQTGATTGSYAVPTYLDPTILITNDGSNNVMRRISRVVQQPFGNTWNGVSSDGVTASFDAELAEVSDDTPTLVQPSVDIERAQAFVQASIEWWQDAPNATEEILKLFADARDNLEEEKFTVGAGSGSNEPTGVFTTIAATTASRVVSTTAATIGLVDLHATWEALGSRYRRRASWVANTVYWSAVRELGAAVSASYSGDLREPMTSRLLGAAAYETDYAPSTQTTTALDSEILVGDFSSGYVIADRPGLDASIIPHLFSTSNNLPNGSRGMYALWRTGGGVVDSNAFRLLVDKTSA